MKKLLALLVLVLIFFSGVVFATTGTGKVVVPEVKKITHFLSFDLDKKDFTVYDSTDDVQVYVIGPEGVSPAVVVAETDDKKGVLLASKAIATKLLHKDAPDDPLKPSTPPAAQPTPLSPSESLKSAGI